MSESSFTCSEPLVSGLARRHCLLYVIQQWLPQDIWWEKITKCLNFHQGVFDSFHQKSKHVKIICKFRISAHNLRIESGRYEITKDKDGKKIPLERYYTIIVFCWGQYDFLWTLKTILTEAFKLRWILISKVHKNLYWLIQKTVIVLLH